MKKVRGQAEGGMREDNKGPECKPLEDPYQLEVRVGKTIPGPASPQEGWGAYPDCHLRNRTRTKLAEKKGRA